MRGGQDLALLLICEQGTNEEIVSGLTAGADVVLPHDTAVEMWVACVKAALRAYQTFANCLLWGHQHQKHR